MRIIFNDLFSAYEYHSCQGISQASRINFDQFDVIILNYFMHDSDSTGLDVEKILIEKKRFQGKIIFMTGCSKTAEELKSKNRLVIVKPFDADKIKETILSLYNGEDQSSLKKKLEGISNFKPDFPEIIS
jgi:DNA-binding NtrC family response regulator